MRFRAFEHQKAVDARLEQLDPKRRLFFGLWCLDALWQLFGDYLPQLIDKDGVSVLVQARQQLLVEATGGMEAGCGPAVSFALRNIVGDPEGSEFMEDEPFSGVLRLADVLQGLATGKPSAPRQAAFAVIDSISQYIDFRSPQSTQMLGEEAARQLMMIDRLLSTPKPEPSLLREGREVPSVKQTSTG